MHTSIISAFYGRYVIAIILLLSLNTIVSAQDSTNDGVLTNADVFVTVQHSANLRRGPGRLWEVLTVLSPGTTLRATGRVAGWVQVLVTGGGEQESVYGWLSRDLLIWTGDINSLPLDGVAADTFLRVQNYTLTLTPEMQIYRNTTFGIGERVAEPLPCIDVEYTGRLGGGSIYWMQFWCDGAYYWVGSHYFFEPTSNSDIVFNAPVGMNNFDYRYGRLVFELRNTGNLAVRRISTMNNIWNSLSAGNEVSCNRLPAEVPSPDISQDDLDANPEFLAAYRALETALDYVNAAVTAFHDVCGQLTTQPLIDPQTVSDAQANLTEARSYLYLAQQFYFPLANRDPYASGSN